MTHAFDMQTASLSWLLVSVTIGVAVGCGNADQDSGDDSIHRRKAEPRATTTGSAGTANGEPSGNAGVDTAGGAGMPAGLGTTSEFAGSAGTGAATESSAMNGLAGASSSVGRRVVAIGDLHSDIVAARKAFMLAGATNENDEWIGGSLTIVQTGDLIGRSEDERQVLDFVFDIREKAEVAGGKVHNLIGNHEVMGARVDNQAVGLDPFPGYVDLPNLALDDPRLQSLPENQRARGAALMAGGPYAKRFAEFPTVLRLGDTVFVHGGLVPRWAAYGIEQINLDVSQWFLGHTTEPDAALGVDDGDRAMWTRQFSSAVDATDCEALAQSLSILGAKRMIVAHTVQSAIAAYCDNRVWVVDVGMSRYYGGPIEVLEIVDDEILTVLR